MSYLVDVNVWFALAVGNHVHHELAHSWFATVPTHSAAFCRTTQAGLLRLLSAPSAMAGSALSNIQAWGVYRTLIEDERVYFAVEPAGIEAGWEEYATQVWPFRSRWTDAYLAAFAQRAELTMVSFDTGFRDAPGLRTTVLTP